MNVFAFLTDIITVDFVVNMATKFTNVMVVSIVTDVRSLQWFCVSLYWHFLSLKSECAKFVHCRYGYRRDTQKLVGCLTVHLPHEIIWNANLMQQGNLINVFLARHVSGTYAHHQEHWMFESQHMVFCTEFLDGWWSWEPLRMSCVRCGWCRRTAPCVWSRNLVNEEALAHWRLLDQEQNKLCLMVPN